MDDELLLDIEEHSLKGISEDNVLKKIWTRPRDTFRFLFANSPSKYVVPLMIIGGMVSALENWSEKNGFQTQNSWLYMVGVIIGGAIAGWIIYWIYAWGISATGKWLGGNASVEKCATVVAWAVIPGILGILLIIPEQMLMQQPLSAPIHSPSNLYPGFSNYQLGIFGLSIIRIIIGIWSIYIAIEGIALIQGFNRWKAFFNYILPILVIMVPLGAIMFFTYA